MGSNIFAELPESPWWCQGGLSYVHVKLGGVPPKDVLVVKTGSVMLFLC